MPSNTSSTFLTIAAIAVGSVGIMAAVTSATASIQNAIYQNAATLAETVSRNQAIQTATLAELTKPDALVGVVRTGEVMGDPSKPETYYVRTSRVDGVTLQNCYLAIDGVAVPNTCYTR